MHGLERVLYWLTESDGNYQGLTEDVLFEQFACDETCLSEWKEKSKMIHDMGLLVSSQPDAALKLLHEKSSDGKTAAIATAAARIEGGLWPDIDWSKGPAQMCGERRCNCGGKKV